MEHLVAPWARGWRPRFYPLGPIVAAAAGLLAYAVLGLSAPAALVGLIAWAAVAARERWRRSRRAAALGSALLGAVDLLGQLLPAGHGTRQALVVLAQSGPAELRPEIQAVLARLEFVSLEEALGEAQQRICQPLFTLVSTALVVGNRSGGRLSPLLQELSRAAHQLDAVQSQLRAEQAQGRLGALVIAAMPVCLLVLLRLVNPQYLAPYATVQGELTLGAMLALIAAGYLWMLRILRLPQTDPPVLERWEDGAHPAADLVRLDSSSWGPGSEGGIEVSSGSGGG